MLKGIANWLILTKTERNVILFLVITLIVGASIRLYQAMVPSAQQFDYRSSDSTFTLLSSIPDDSIAVENKGLSKELPTKLNINIATKEELVDLPGIGEVTAERIIEYRNNIGRYDDIKDLQAVKGMSTKKIEKLKSLITTQ
jgi:competence ComEA-like helix-hairpin-helix protein